jgi:hypothetical protein
MQSTPALRARGSGLTRATGPAQTVPLPTRRRDANSLALRAGGIRLTRAPPCLAETGPPPTRLPVIAKLSGAPRQGTRTRCSEHSTYQNTRPTLPRPRHPAADCPPAHAGPGPVSQSTKKTTPLAHRSGRSSPHPGTWTLRIFLDI